MGKSTHTQMWHDLLQTPYLNGDLNLLGMESGKIIVYGIPWCGTSGIYTTTDHELGGIVLLGRDPEKDFLQELSPSEKVIRIMQRMISPSLRKKLPDRCRFCICSAPEIHLLFIQFRGK